MNRELETQADLLRERQAIMRAEARTSHLLGAAPSEPTGIPIGKEGRAVLKRRLAAAAMLGALLALAVAQAVAAAAAGGGGGGSPYLRLVM